MAHRYKRGHIKPVTHWFAATVNGPFATHPAGVSERGVDDIETMDGPEILNSVDQIEKLDKVARRTLGLNDNPFPPGFSLNVLNINSLQIDQDIPETR